MSNWIATNELRYYLRLLKWEAGEGGTRIPLKIGRTLQQKWERYESEWYEGEPEIEWRDVPVVEEE